MSKAGQIFKRLTPYNIKKGVRYLKHYGVKGFYARLLERFEEREVEYQEWYEKHKLSEEELASTAPARTSSQPAAACSFR